MQKLQLPEVSMQRCPVSTYKPRPPQSKLKPVRKASSPLLTWLPSCSVTWPLTSSPRAQSGEKLSGSGGESVFIPSLGTHLSLMLIHALLFGKQATTKSQSHKGILTVDNFHQKQCTVSHTEVCVFSSSSCAHRPPPPVLMTSTWGLQQTHSQ